MPPADIARQDMCVRVVVGGHDTPIWLSQDDADEQILLIPKAGGNDNTFMAM